MDKYSFDKYQKGSSTLASTPNSGSSKGSKTMRHGSSKKKVVADEESIRGHDVMDGFNNGPSKVSNSNDPNLSIGSTQASIQKSMNDISIQASSQSSLQWETRQIRILQAATLDHVLKFILLINSPKDLNSINNGSDKSFSSSTSGDGSLEEERNNVAHIIHVLFCTYRIYTNPYELMLKLMDYSDICRIEQYRFVMHYWMDNYPEDFDYIVDNPENCDASQKESSIGVATQSTTSYNNSITSFDSSMTTRTAATSDSENSNAKQNDIAEITSTSAGSQSGVVDGGSDTLNRRLSNLSIRTNNDNDKSSVPLVSELLRLCRDEYIRKRAIRLSELRTINMAQANNFDNDTSRRSRQSHGNGSSRNSAVLDLDSRYIAQQLTAIDLENFLNLRIYSLLEGTRSDKRVQSMIKNFNLLSRHVVVTILRSHNPTAVTSHWIAIAMNLRKIKNFNSLKAIIAGLTNESIYRLKQLIWNKLDRTSLANFKLMASIVDDVNNQIVLRQTQLVVEGTAKMSIEDDSFGTIPYLGTFLTDLNMIDARYSTYVPSPKDETSKLKLINFEKCAKQFEILTQVQLLQKNVLASLHAIQRRNHFDEQTTLNRLKLELNQNRQTLPAKPAIPKVARLFENWFYDNSVASMTDKQW